MQLYSGFDNGLENEQQTPKNLQIPLFSIQVNLQLIAWPWQQQWAGQLIAAAQELRAGHKWSADCSDQLCSKRSAWLLPGTEYRQKVDTDQH